MHDRLLFWWPVCVRLFLILVCAFQEINCRKTTPNCCWWREPEYPWWTRRSWWPRSSTWPSIDNQCWGSNFHASCRQHPKDSQQRAHLFTCAVSIHHHTSEEGESCICNRYAVQHSLQWQAVWLTLRPVYYHWGEVWETLWIQSDDQEVLQMWKRNTT